MSKNRYSIFKNAKIVDTINQNVYKGWFSVVNGFFEYVEEGNYHENFIDDIDVIDLNERYVIPGLIDSHMHIESSLLTPGRFSEAVIPWGTCCVLQDPHEMANVFGAHGVIFMIENSLFQDLRIYTAIPSCVPTTRKHLESCNAKITTIDIIELSKQKNVIALGEVMDYNSVLVEDEEIMQILAAAKNNMLSIEGHCPTLKGKKLSKYIAHGIRSDHTFTNPRKIFEQLRKGMYVMLQTKSVTKENINFINKLKDKSRILFVTDDIPAVDLLDGHLNKVVQLAISMGLDPIEAITSATRRPADYLGIKDLGSISPGKVASFFLVRNLRSINPECVFINGEIFSSKKSIKTRGKKEFSNSLRIRKLLKSDFRMLKQKKTVRLSAYIITVNDENTCTGLVKEEIKFKEGYPIIKNKDLVQIAIFRRHEVEPIGAIGFVKGLNIENGAFATSFAHDSHNLLVIGKKPENMVKSANAVIQAGGGMAISSNFDTFLLKLPIGGLISDEHYKEVAKKQHIIESKLKFIGMEHKHPLLLLTVLALTVSPRYKMSDFGIVDTENSCIVPIIPTRDF